MCCDWLSNLCGLTSGFNQQTDVSTHYEALPSEGSPSHIVNQIAQNTFRPLQSPPNRPHMEAMEIYSPSPTGSGRSSASKQSGEGTDQEVSSPPACRQK